MESTWHVGVEKSEGPEDRSLLVIDHVRKDQVERDDGVGHDAGQRHGFAVVAPNDYKEQNQAEKAVDRRNQPPGKLAVAEKLERGGSRPV